MIFRITAACPEALLSDANNLAMVLAQSEADNQTYQGLNWQDADGNLYAAASWPAQAEWVVGAQSALTRPAWDTEPYVINMAAANRAQAALVFWTPDMGGDVPQAVTDKLTAIGGMSGQDALTAMGLTPVPVEVEGDTE